MGERGDLTPTPQTLEFPHINQLHPWLGHGGASCGGRFVKQSLAGQSTAHNAVENNFNLSIQKIDLGDQSFLETRLGNISRIVNIKWQTHTASFEEQARQKYKESCQFAFIKIETQWRHSTVAKVTRGGSENILLMCFSVGVVLFCFPFLFLV